MSDPRAVLEADALRKMGLTEAPKIRYDDLPSPEVGETETDPRRLVNHRKALLLVDPLLTARFANFIHPSLEVDQAIDTRSFKNDWSVDFRIRTDLPPPVNDRVTAATGVTKYATISNFMQWLAVEIRNEAERLGTKRIGPPLVWRTSRHGKMPPQMGVMVKYDRTPRDGQTVEDAVANLGLLVPQQKVLASEEDSAQNPA